MSGSEKEPGKRYRDGYVTVRDALVLHYRDYPGSAERPPLLCLHGLTRNARDFDTLAAALASRLHGRLGGRRSGVAGARTGEGFRSPARLLPDRMDR